VINKKLFTLSLLPLYQNTLLMIELLTQILRKFIWWG